jgi:hypothetical protein
MMRPVRDDPFLAAVNGAMVGSSAALGAYGVLSLQAAGYAACAGPAKRHTR